MSLIVILLCLIIVFLIIYIGFILNQLNSINKQLHKRLSENTRQPLNVVLFNKTIIKLASNINHCLKLEEKRRLDSINEQKQFKELISNISHDLRTPLTSIKGYQQLLQNSDLDKEQLHNLQIAQKSTDELGNLIEHFFEYSYLITSNIKPNLEKINISNLIVEPTGVAKLSEILRACNDFKFKGLFEVFRIKISLLKLKKWIKKPYYCNFCSFVYFSIIIRNFIFFCRFHFF